MTALAQTGQKAERRGRLLWIVLALSLALNLFFIAGLGWMRFNAPPPPFVRMEHFSDSLNLSAGQRHAYEQFLHTIRTRGRFVRRSNRPLIRALWAELAKPQPDRTAVSKLAAQIYANHETFLHDVSAALDAFIKTLSPDQRAEFAAKAQAPRDPAARWLFRMVVP